MDVYHLDSSSNKPRRPEDFELEQVSVFHEQL